MKEQIIENSLPLILNVVKYTSKNKLTRKNVNHSEQQGSLSKYHNTILSVGKLLRRKLSWISNLEVTIL